MNLYFDTSAFCRYYHPEPGSDRVIAIADDPASRCVVSWLTIMEAHSAFAQLVRIGAIESPDFVHLRANLDSDLGCRRWKAIRVFRQHYETAAELIVNYGEQRRLRSLDALHLGIFLGLQSLGEVDHLVTADRTLAELAVLEGVRVINPLSA